MSSYISTDDLAALDLSANTNSSTRRAGGFDEGAPQPVKVTSPVWDNAVQDANSHDRCAKHQTSLNEKSHSATTAMPASQDDLVSNAGMTPGTVPAAATSPSSSTLSSSPCSIKKVMFCPLALLIQTAADGEKDPAVVQGQKSERMGRPRIAVRTYSVDTPSISTATSRAWRNVCAGFNSSFKPLLASTVSGGGGGTLSSSPYRRPSSPERELERTSYARSRAYDEEKDPRFTPNPRPTGMRIKLPTIASPRALPLAGTVSSPTGRSILKSPGSGHSTGSQGRSPTQGFFHSLDTTALPLVRSPDDFPALSPLTDPDSSSGDLFSSEQPRSIASYSASPPKQPVAMPLPLLASSPRASTNPASNVGVVPVSNCCRKCGMAADYGLNPDDHYEERWTIGARRKRARDREEAGESRITDSPGQSKGSLDGTTDRQGTHDDTEDYEEEVPPPTMGFGRVVVDELQASGRANKSQRTEVGSDIVPEGEDENEDESEDHDRVGLLLGEVRSQDRGEDSTVASEDTASDGVVSTPLTSPDPSNTPITGPEGVLAPEEAEIRPLNPAADNPPTSVPAPSSSSSEVETSRRPPIPPLKTKRRFSASKVGKTVLGAGAGFVAGMGGGGRSVRT